MFEGFFFGRTRLIKLSPKKTWEGFLGAFVSTVIFGICVSCCICFLYVFYWKHTLLIISGLECEVIDCEGHCTNIDCVSNYAMHHTHSFALFRNQIMRKFAIHNCIIMTPQRIVSACTERFLLLKCLMYFLFLAVFVHSCQVWLLYLRKLFVLYSVECVRGWEVIPCWTVQSSNLSWDRPQTAQNLTTKCVEAANIIILIAPQQ